MKKFGAWAMLFLFLITVVAMPAFAAKETATAPQEAGFVQSVLDPVQASLIRLGAFLPKLGGLFVIIVVGALIAVGIAILVSKILDVIRLEKGAKKIKIPDILKRGGIKLSLSELITDIIFFLIIIGTLIVALEYYGLGTTNLTNIVLGYIPHVIAAVFVLILGIFVAIIISGIITLVGGNIRIAQSEALGNIAKYAIIILAGIIALRELGLGIILTGNSKDIILGSLALGLALAFGLGAKEKAGKFLDRIFKP